MVAAGLAVTRAGIRSAAKRSRERGDRAGSVTDVSTTPGAIARCAQRSGRAAISAVTNRVNPGTVAAAVKARRIRVGSSVEVERRRRNRLCIHDK